MPTLRGVTHAAPGEAIKYNTQHDESRDGRGPHESCVCTAESKHQPAAHLGSYTHAASR